ncbi:MAG: tol-pal system protein YbgF [Saccharospirillum sp.]|nr:tol-pal system protein YbgF [Saccharospirillum sp.]
MLKQLVTYSAALLGSTLFLSTQVVANPPVVQSQPSHVAGQGSSQGRSAGPDAAFVENLMLQVQDLQRQMAEQRGLIEELHHQLQMLNQEQRERYIDLDQRMLMMQQQAGEAGTSGGGSNTGGSSSTAAVSDEAVLNEYNAARELIRERQFPEAIAALNRFTENHPDHSLTPNAWYWLGEVHLVNREVADASRAFQKLVDQFPRDAKVPDSLYKLGVIAQQQGDQSEASRLYRKVMEEFPDSQSAKLSEARLASN